MIKTTLRIDGMMCGMCESHVNDVIRRNFDVNKVTSSHSKNRTTIISKTELDYDKLAQVIAETGYRVLDISVDEVKQGGLLSWLKGNK